MHLPGKSIPLGTTRFSRGKIPATPAAFRIQHLPDAYPSHAHAIVAAPMRAKNLTDKLLAERGSDRHIATLTRRLIAATDPDQATELATLLVNSIRERIDRLRSRTVSTAPQKNLPK